MLGHFATPAQGFQIQAKGHDGLCINSGTEDEIETLPFKRTLTSRASGIISTETLLSPFHFEVI